MNRRVLSKKDFEFVNNTQKYLTYMYMNEVLMKFSNI